MAKINILDKSVYNLISAGEVVERPASVVKELVENSIDAGASEIIVSIEEGGLSKIVVVDNGSGIDREDMNICYLPHTTSKIAKASDLDEISTLGFRGEALASITAVAQVEIASKTAGDEVGYRLNINGAQIANSGEVGMSTGTKIVVSNLFFNTPVRRKFLKKPKSEEASVTQVMTELIFANPDVKFSYSCDGKVVFDTNRGLENSIFEIFGTEIANKMLPFDKTNGNIRVYGYVGDRTVYKHNRNSQTIVVNGRTVESTTVQTAVAQAYGNRLMTRCYPVFVINIILPFDEVDVNVHPNKKEVRFANSQQIFSRVYHAVEETLADDEKVAVLFDSTPKTIENNENVVRSLENTGLGDIVDNISQAYIDKKDESVASDLAQNYKNLELNKIIEKQKSLVDIGNTPHRFTDNSALRKVSDNVGTIRRGFDNSMQNKLELCNEESENDLKILGQLFDTYLVLEYQNFAYIIDQHACHERYLYDNLKEKIDDGDVSKQPLLVPYILECNPSQFDYVQAISNNLAQIGFEIEEFGGLSYKIYAVPAILNDIDLDEFFADIVSERKVLENAKQSELIKDKLAMTACKAAIKAGDKLSKEQIKSLIVNMKKGVPVQCPHGRPALIKLSRADLDKMFKRIV